MILLLSIDNDRPQALERLLSEAGCRDTVVHVRLAGDPTTWTRSVIDTAMVRNNLEPARDCDVIVPTGAADTKWLLTRGDCVVGGIVHGQASLRVFDKRWLLAQATQAGIPIPVTWTSQDDIGADDLPVFYKDAYERESGVRGLIRTSQDLASVPTGDVILQEFIDSPGTYGVGFLARDGDVVVSYSHFESSSNPATGGSGVILQPCSDTRLLRHTERLVRHLGYSGWGLAEFKYCPNRRDYVLMEINAKFWGSCELAFRNEPQFLRVLFGVETVPQEIERMVFLHRAFARGPRYLTRHRHELLNSRRILYRGWPRSLVSGLLPGRFIQILRSVRSTVRGKPVTRSAGGRRRRRPPHRSARRHTRSPAESERC